jgi:hypothetical protein
VQSRANLAAACAVSNPPGKKRNNKKVHLLTKHGNRLNVKKEQQVSVFQVPIGQELTQVHLLPTVPANRSTGERERNEHEMEQEIVRRQSAELILFLKIKKWQSLSQVEACFSD